MDETQEWCVYNLNRDGGISILLMPARFQVFRRENLKRPERHKRKGIGREGEATYFPGAPVRKNGKGGVGCDLGEPCLRSVSDGGKVCGLPPCSTAEFPNENSVTFKPQLSLQSDLELSSQVYLRCKKPVYSHF